MDHFIGTILPWPVSYAPQGWAFCDGSLLNINQFAALYSLLGINYGGDGKTNFALPDLRGRVPLGAGPGPGLTNRPIGTKGGKEIVDQVLKHTHLAVATTDKAQCNISADFKIPASTGGADIVTPKDKDCYLAAGKYGGRDTSNYTASTNVNMPGGKLTATGTVTGIGVNVALSGVDTVSNMQPFLTINYIICIEGIYPPRP